MLELGTGGWVLVSGPEPLAPGSSERQKLPVGISLNRAPALTRRLDSTRRSEHSRARIRKTLCCKMLQNVARVPLILG